MKVFKKGSVILITGIMLLSCTACSGLDKLADGLKSGVERVGSNVAIGKSNALITPYQFFDGRRTSDNTAFQATYDATVNGLETPISRAAIAARLQYTIFWILFLAFVGWSIPVRIWRKMYWLKKEMAVLRYSLRVEQTILDFMGLTMTAQSRLQ